MITRIVELIDKYIVVNPLYNPPIAELLEEISKQYDHPLAQGLIRQ
jgi:hypothetical protein